MSAEVTGSTKAGQSEGVTTLRILIDPALCSGHGRCYSTAPDVYSCDDEGFPVSRGEVIDVPAGLANDAMRGVHSCPEGAIRVVD